MLGFLTQAIIDCIDNKFVHSRYNETAPILLKTEMRHYGTTGSIHPKS